MKNGSRWRVLNLLSLIFIAFTFVNASPVFAGPGRTTYQAKIVKPDGLPLEASSVNFKFTILDPAGSCILYSETYSSVNMASTGGLISFALGSGVKTYPASATTFQEIFSNITPTLSCDAGGPGTYSPGANDIRKIVMQFHDGTGWQTLPAMSINAVPYAMYADDATKLNGLTASDFVQLSTVPTCGASEALRYTGASFNCIAVGGGVTSSTVVTALGYTPADGASVTTLTSNVSSVSSTVFAVSSTVTSLQNSVAASFAAITSSQWTTSGTNVFYNTGNVGIGTTLPVTKLDVSGGVRIGAESTTCAAALAGTLRYNAANVEYCNGTSWQAFGVSGAGITNFNGSTSGTQSFTTGTGGTAPNFSTSNGVHTLNIPLASTGSVTAGLLSNSDYTTFSNKITSSAASIAQVLGYVPADNSVSGTYAQKANNLSDLTNVATARTNLGLGTFATASSIDLGSASATGTLSIARLPSFTGDATIAAASNTIILSNSGVTAGTYTKVTVDSKGRVTSGSTISSSDVTTALGYTPANSTSSTQWTTSGSAIYYNSGYVGVGTNSPTSRFNIVASAADTQPAVKIDGTATSQYALSVAGDGAATLYASNSGGFSAIQAVGNLGQGLFASSNSTDGVFATTNGGVGFAAVEGRSNGSAAGVMGYSQSGISGFFKTFNNSGTNTNPTLVTRLNSNQTADLFQAQNASGTSLFSISSIGSVGIGTNTPTSKLHITEPDDSWSSAIRMDRSWDSTTDYFQMMYDYEGLKFRTMDNGDDTADIIFKPLNSEALRIAQSGNVGLGTPNPTAKLHLAAGTASVAPLKFTSGTLLTSAQSGTMEYDGFNLYFTDGTNTRRLIATGLNAGSIDNASNVNNSSGDITMTPNGSVIVSSTTASTSSNTGALVVKGGLGVAGNIYSSGTIVTSSNIGIGTNNPISSLQISNTGSYTSVPWGSPAAANENQIYGALTIGDRGTGGSLAIRTPSANTTYPSGLGIDGSYNSSIATINLKAFGPQAGGSYGSNLTFSTTAGTVITEAMRIDRLGNVGIGTNAPARRLDILHNTNGWAQGVLTNTDTGNSAAARFLVQNANSSISIQKFGTGNTATGSQSADYGSVVDSGFGLNLVASAASGTLKFYTGGTATTNERMTITNTGNVGIGTTNPSYPLDVKNEMRIGAQGGSDVTRIAGGSGYGSQIYQYYADGVLKNLFSANGNSYITGANFGVGTSAPTVKLDVSDNAGRSIRVSPTGYAGDFNNMPLIHLENTNNVADDWLLVNNADKFYIATEAAAGSEKLTVAASGYVGIGTSNPTQLLQVGSGSSNAVAEVRGNGAGYSAGLRVWNANTAVGAHSYLDFGWGVSAAVAAIQARSQTDNSTNLVFQASTVTGARFDALTINGATGNVGVGVVGVASAALDIAATATSAENIRLRGRTAIEGGQISLMDGTGTGGWEIDNYGASGTERLRFFRDKGENNIVEPMVIAPTGYVGVKNTDPQAVLDVGGSVLLRGGAAHANASPSYGGTFFSFDGATNTAGLWSVNASTSQFAFYTKTDGTDAGTERLRITSAGNVGIGTSAPVTKLNIGGMGAANATALRIDSQDTYYRDIFMSEFNTTSYGGILRYHSGLDLLSLITMENGVEKYGVAVARATGYVGIGMNSAASYPLDVNGDIRITGTPYRNSGDSAWIVPSDARLKDVSGKYNRGLREIANIDTIYFNYKKDNPKQIDPSVTYTGVLAQQVQKQIPEAVKEDKEGFLSLNTTPIFWAMLNAVKELYYDVVGIKTENAQLKAQTIEQARKIQSLEEENAAIKDRLDRLEKAIQNNK